MRLLAIALLSLGSNLTCQAASDMACELARTAAEKRICATPSLIQRDADLAELYEKLRRHESVDKSRLVNSQKKWLSSRRDECQADEECLERVYLERISELQFLQRLADSYQPDSVDLGAAQKLREAIAAQMSLDPEFPAEKTIRRFEISDGITSFSNVPPDAVEAGEFENSKFPTKPPPGVTDAEWKALLASSIDGGGEHGSASYVLIDLDRDGIRDLMVESYIGGTGLFTYTSLLKGGSGKFSGAVFSVASESADGEAFFYINGRGANQSYRWILLNGRVYAAYTDGSYGRDTVYLLRPFTQVGEVPAVQVDYTYQFTVPASQHIDNNNKAELDAGTVASLRRAVASMSRSAAHHKPAPICPSTGSSDDAEADTSYGPGHYSFEIIADFPVWLDGVCHIGQAVNWFGSYSDSAGLHAQLWVRKPSGQSESIDASERTFQLQARRKAVRVSSTTAVFASR